MSNSLWPHELQPVRLLCPWDSPGKNTGVGFHFFLLGNLPHPGSNSCVLHLLDWQVDSLPLSHLGSTSPKMMIKTPLLTHYTQCPKPCIRPPLTHASVRDSWIHTGKSGSVSFGTPLLSPGSWCAQCYVCALQESVSPVLCKFWCLYGGVNSDLFQEGLYHTKVCFTQSPCPVAVHCWPVTLQESLEHNSVSVSVGSLGPGVHKVFLSPLSISGGCGIWF